MGMVRQSRCFGGVNSTIALAAIYMSIFFFNARFVLSNAITYTITLAGGFALNSAGWTCTAQIPTVGSRLLPVKHRRSFPLYGLFFTQPILGATSGRRHLHSLHVLVLNLVCLPTTQCHYANLLLTRP